MYAVIHLAKNNELYVTLNGDNHEKVFTSETYRETNSAVHAIQLVAPVLIGVRLDQSILDRFEVARALARRVLQVFDGTSLEKLMNSSALPEPARPDWMNDDQSHGEQRDA